MKVTKRNVLEIILESLCFLMLFVPGTFVEEYWEWDRGASTSIFGVNFHGVMSLERETDISFLEAALHTNTYLEILGLIIFAVLIATVIVMIRQLVAKGEKRNSLWAALGSIAVLVLYLVFTVALYFTVDQNINYDLAYSINWLYSVQLALFIASAAVTMIGYVQAKKLGIAEEPGSTKEEAAAFSVDSVADELLKYKELLDAGAITEEEFLAIKKKLL